MESLWPILLIWVLFAIFGSRRKRPTSTGESVMRPTGRPAAGAAGGFMAQLQLALEELKQAERQAMAPGGTGTPASGTAREPAPPDTQSTARARAYLETKRLAAAKREGSQRRPQQGSSAMPPRSPLRRPVLPMADDDADKASEDAAVASLEGRDYDDEAIRIIEERHKAAERGGRVEASSEDLSASQVARREGRASVAIGGAREHADWHTRVEAPLTPAAATAGPAARRGILARWANGTPRSAVVLGEILGPPAGSR